MDKYMIYTVPREKHNEEDLKSILNVHKEIKFVSLVGVDLLGNDTDEKIPVKNFLEDIHTFLSGMAAQTDGSSVILPGIAKLNNAKVDMKADLDCNWFVDYNYENIDEETNKPIGTLRIPCFLYHEGKAVDSRNILKSTITFLKQNIMKLLEENKEALNYYGVTFDEIDEVEITSATELEFWVKSPNELAELEALSTSQALKEQYWKRTKGSVRTALEQSLLLMDEYGLEPEMGHKEVGGVTAKLSQSGDLVHVMEQLEIDWKYSNAIQACDNELFIRTLIKETFRRNKLEVTFAAKPIDNVAGSGKHVHMGIVLKLKNNKRINLFTSKEGGFISPIGYGALMGMLKNYEVMNPFISSSNDAFRRLKPGFEAPICIVTSLGLTKDVPSRNRTILIGLIRDMENPMATRFELRSPSPRTNTYLTLATMNMCILDGIRYVIKNNKNEEELLDEMSKKPGEDSPYLEKHRSYRSEEDIFEDFSEEEREEFFGKSPRTVYENIIGFDNCKDKLKVITEGNIITENIINSYKIAILNKCAMEIEHRIILNYMDEVRSCKILHHNEIDCDLDKSNWEEIKLIRENIMKDTNVRKSIFSEIREAINNKEYDKLSELQILLEEEMKNLRDKYISYSRNLIDFNI
ncbi:glutamine synthetase [Clostridium sp. UBA6640]|uniref:glutamine synthetase n=1 Tax=Clostridium sp. UBA6640 TaxID=1946370 RepID=UPI0025C62D42|nr:glutamine synthetase [Clostridium sp. UBA6640]